MEENEGKKRALMDSEGWKEGGQLNAKRWKSSSSDMLNDPQLKSFNSLPKIDLSDKIMTASNSELPFLVEKREAERTNCDREPIHSLNLIQNHGFLFVVDLACNVIRTTENVALHTGYDTEEVIGDTIFRFLKGFDISREEHDCKLEKKGGERVSVHCLCHQKVDGTTFIECEVGVDDGFQYGQSLTQFLVALNRVNGDLKEILSVAAKTVRDISGYDRVLIYQFDHKYNGTVLAENSNITESFLGLTFPASDIPHQARELFRKNRFRMVTDSQSAPSKIVPEPSYPIDLSMFTLRASSQIHVAYLQNMGVRASMTISIVVGPEKRLWGLITCHKFGEPLKLSWSRRRFFHLLGNMVSAQVENCITRKEAKDRLLMEVKISQARDTLIHLDMKTSPYKKLYGLFPSWKEMIECDGIMLITQGERYTHGIDGETVHHIIDWVDTNVKDTHTFFACETIEEMGLQIEDGGFCGFMYVRLKDARYAGLYFFRKERKETITWGGEPKKPDEHGNLTPRTSFERFQQEIRGHCARWNEVSIEYGVHIQSLMTRYIFRWWEEEGRMNLLSEKKEFEKLMKENESAKLAAKNRSVFLANVTHELRTPIHSILGSSEKLEEVIGLGDPEGSIACSMIRSSGEHLLNLISDINDMSQLESSSLEINPFKFDFYTHIENVCQTMYSVAFTKGVFLNCLVANNIPLIFGDSMRVGQILLNFLSNAVKFTEIGGVTMAVEVVTRSPERITLHYTVTDTGLGIKKEEMKLLFLKYSQLEAGRARKSEGTGLGLAISKNLAEEMGGKVWAESELGVGSKFHLEISFPVIEPENLPYASVKREEKLNKVVVMDTRDFVLDFMKFHFGSWGLQLDVVRKMDHLSLHCDESTLALFIGLKEGDRTPLRDLIEEIRKKTPNLIVSILENKYSKDLRRTLGSNVGLIPMPLSLHRIHVHLHRTKNTMKESSGAVVFPKFSSFSKKLHVLCVEDNKMNQQIAQNFLSSLGHSSEVVENGADAVDALQTSRFDVVLMDVMMPVMDGITATKTIRQTEKQLRKDPIPIIGTSAGGDPSLKRECLEAGMIDCIYKPFRKVHLEAVLLKIIEEMEQKNGEGTA